MLGFKYLGFLRTDRTCQRHMERLEFFLNLFVNLGSLRKFLKFVPQVPNRVINRKINCFNFLDRICNVKYFLPWIKLGLKVFH